MAEGQPDQSIGRVIFSNGGRKLEQLLEGKQRKTRFLVLADSPRYGQIRGYLGGLDNTEEIDLAAEIRSLRPGFSVKYIGLLSGLNRANASFWWWAFYFTRKESMYSNLAERVFYCYLIGQVINQSPTCDTVIVTDDRLVAAQMDSWATGQGYTSINALDLGWRLKERAKTFAAARIGFTLLRALHYWLIVKLFWRTHVETDAEYIAFGTLIDERCFAGDGGYHDIYLGELPEFMASSGIKVMVYGGMLWGTWKALSAMRKKPPNFPVLPWFYDSTITGIVNAAWRSLIKYISPIYVKGEQAIDGIPVNRLINDSMKVSLRSGQYFESLWVYHSAQRMAKRLKVSACVMPYENRSWEKMLLAGLNANGNGLRSVGFHHAAITPAHTNLYLGPGESEVIPLPDTIVMPGEITKELLETKGNYPEGFLKAGCALRQGRKSEKARSRRNGGKVTNILVAMATTEDEYVETLLFLEEALLGVGGYKVGVRPHPEISVARALLRVPGLKLDFQLMDGPLDGNLDWADVVMYVSSTVGLDAVSAGIPAIGIDLGKFIDYDPAPEGCPFKWSVTSPKQLVPVLQEIEGISDAEYESLQDQASDFGRRYFHPVTDKALKEFSDLVMNTGQKSR